MLKSVRLRNFKLHEDTKIDAARITVFIGPNNSGKSSIFHALLALKQAVSRGSDTMFLQRAQRQATSAEQPYLFPAFEAIDLGEFLDVVRQGLGAIEIGFSAELQAEQTPRSYASELDLDLDIQVQDNRLRMHKGSVQTAYGRIAWEFAVGLAASPPSRIKVEDCTLSFLPLETFWFLNAVPEYPPNTSQAKQALLNELGECFRAAPRVALISLHPVFPVRGFEEWGYPITAAPPQRLDMLTLPDRAIALTNALAGNWQLRAQVSQRLGELLGIGIDFETVAGKRLKIWATHASNGSPGTLFANEGTGANQLPFIVVPVALANRGDTVLLSEPEAHLHPRMQSELVSNLLKMQQKLDLQFLVETHSEHILHRLLHAVAVAELRQDEVALYYFRNLDGVAKAERLEVNQYGQVKGGLPGFFEQSLAELSSYLDALRKP